MKKKAGKPGKRTRGDRDAELRKHLVDLLKGGGAHVHFRDAIDGFPARKRGAFAKGLPHTGWQLLEHARLAQNDIVEFCGNPKHVSQEFPEGYWPKSPVPPNDAAWKHSWDAFENDLQRMIRLVRNPKTDLLAKIPHGSGQTLLREALVLADHNSYHLGQLVVLRRALGAWPEE
jgi:hypothetical protein